MVVGQKFTRNLTGDYFWVSDGNYKRYDTIEEFNVDSKAECNQLNLAQETKLTNASAHLVQYRFKNRDTKNTQT